MRARLHLFEQPHVLDRDHRLVGEGGDELDLLFGKGPGSERFNENAPIGLPSRRAAPRAWPATPRSLCLEESVFRIGENVGHMNRPALEGRPADCSAAPGSNGMLL